MDFVKRYGPWALVTGASSGIGRALAQQLSARGLSVVLVARDETRLRELADTLAGPSRVVALDLGERGAAAALAEQVSDLDVGLVVPAAGFGIGGPHFASSIDRHVAMVDLNCRAVLETIHAFVPALVERGHGGLVLFGSVVGFQGTPWSASYGATKAFALTLGEALQVELAPRGVDVCVAAPGPTRTGFFESAGMQAGAAASPDTVARTILRRLRRRRIVLTDLLALAIRVSLSTAPRWLRVRIMGQVMGSMTTGARPIADRSRPAA